MTIRSQKHQNQGFTLVEMIVVILIIGIMAGVAAPSLLSADKPLRNSVSLFKAQLSLIRSKAIASNQSYRIRPKYPTKAQYTGDKYKQIPHNFIVEYAANCQVSKYGYGIGATGTTDTNRPPNATYPNGRPDGWMQASQFALDLPESVGIDGTAYVNTTATTGGSESFPLANESGTGSVTYEANLRWTICYDNRGLADKPVKLTLKDFQKNNKAVTSSIEVLGLGQLDIKTQDGFGANIPLDYNNNPVF